MAIRFGIRSANKIKKQVTNTNAIVEAVGSIQSPTKERLKISAI